MVEPTLFEVRVILHGTSYAWVVRAYSARGARAAVAEFIEIPSAPRLTGWVSPAHAEAYARTVERRKQDLLVTVSTAEAREVLGRVLVSGFEDVVQDREPWHRADYLSTLLACERGEWAPEGWVWKGSRWENGKLGAAVWRRSATNGLWDWVRQQFDTGVERYALEAINAAERAGALVQTNG